MQATRRTRLKAIASPGLLAASGSGCAAATVRLDARSVPIVVDMQNCIVVAGTLPAESGEDAAPMIRRIAATRPAR